MAIAVVIATPAAAQQAGASLLPGGAPSLTESYGDWTVRCPVVTRNEAQERRCSMSQRHVTREGRQVVAIELASGHAGTEGVMVLPFGLAVSEDVTLTADPAALSFSTCVPTGCLVPVSLGAERLAAMRPGNKLNLRAWTVAREVFALSISLAGFSAASDLLRERGR